MSDHQGYPLPPLPGYNETPILTIRWQDYCDRINLAKLEERAACASILEDWLAMFGSYDTPEQSGQGWARNAMEEALRKIRKRG